MSQMLETVFQSKISRKSRLTGLRRSKTTDIFTRGPILWPEDFIVKGFGSRRHYTVFNPGAILEGRILHVYPRIIVGYFWYTSIIGYFQIDIEELINGRLDKPIIVEPVIVPSKPWDLAGCEDPRVEKINHEYYVLYTALEPSRNRFHAVNAHSYQAIAVLKDRAKLVWRKLIGFRLGDLLLTPPPFEVKDSLIIPEPRNGTVPILVRPMIKGFEAGWRATLSLRDYNVNVEDMELILVAEPWEYKVGFSTNAVKMGSNEYLIAWHGVGIDNIYRTGFIIVDRDGEPLAITENYLLEPKTVQEMAGDRPGVVFGCGLVKYSEKIVFIAGVADTAIGVYLTDLDKILEHMKWIKKS